MLSAELLSIVIVVAIAWFWFDSLKAREVAVRAARTACESEGLLFLDDTVSSSGLKPSRDENGRFALQRAYDFEFSDTGNNRRPGSVVVLGRRVTLLNVGPRESYPRESQ